MKVFWFMLAAFADPQTVRVLAGLDAYLRVPEDNPSQKRACNSGKVYSSTNVCYATIRSLARPATIQAAMRHQKEKSVR